MGNGTAVQQCGLLYDYELALGRWHRSKDKKKDQTSDFTSYMMNKKWWLEEEFNLHMMRFQQVKYRYLFIKQYDIFYSLGWFADQRSPIHGRRRGG